MDASLLSGSRWELLEALAKKPSSTSELAVGIGTSQANVSQQLRQLEIAGIVTKQRTQRKGAHYLYEITDSVLHLTYVSRTAAYKKMYSKASPERFFQALLLAEHGQHLLTYLLTHIDLAKRFISIGYLNRDTPQLFVIAEQVDDIRQHHANTTVKTLEGEKKVVLWSHTKQEVKDGLDRKDPYFFESLKEVTLMYDPKGILQELKEVAEEQ